MKNYWIVFLLCSVLAGPAFAATSVPESDVSYATSIVENRGGNSVAVPSPTAGLVPVTTVTAFVGLIDEADTLVEWVNVPTGIRFTDDFVPTAYVPLEQGIVGEVGSIGPSTGNRSAFDIDWRAGTVRGFDEVAEVVTASVQTNGVSSGDFERPVFVRADPVVFGITALESVRLLNPVDRFDVPSFSFYDPRSSGVLTLGVS